MRSLPAQFTASVASLAVLLGLAVAPVAAQESREQLEQQLKEQQAKNEALKERIAKLEAVLKTDVCTNPEAEAILNQERKAAR
jgi:cell division protein FtsB